MVPRLSREFRCSGLAGRVPAGLAHASALCGQSGWGLVAPELALWLCFGGDASLCLCELTELKNVGAWDEDIQLTSRLQSEIIHTKGVALGQVRNKGVINQGRRHRQ